jgi:hypothetical protein
MPSSTGRVRTIQDATILIEAVAGKVSTIVFDDFSFLAEQTFNYLEKDRHLTGFKLWGALRDVTLTFRDKSRYCGVNIVLNAWEQPPRIDATGKRIKGGPKLSGNLPEQLPAMCDIVLRGVHEPQRRPWPSAYRCWLDPSYTMKDRFDVATRCDPAPMNLGELLRAAGYALPRHPSLPKQEEQVEALSRALSGDAQEDVAMVNELYTKLVESGMPMPFARWTLRDALDRAVIRRALATSRSMFIDTSVPVALA